MQGAWIHLLSSIVLRLATVKLFRASDLPSYIGHPRRNDMVLNQACIDEVTLIE
jgi:hypothetical protein